MEQLIADLSKILMVSSNVCDIASTVELSQPDYEILEDEIRNLKVIVTYLQDKYGNR